MGNKEQTLAVVKWLSAAGTAIGLMITFYSFFVSGATQDYMLSIGIGVMVGFMFIFVTMIFLPLIEEFTGKSKPEMSGMIKNRI
jgi:cadmium resistance protein CadD (predicted permease)